MLSKQIHIKKEEREKIEKIEKIEKSDIQKDMQALLWSKARFRNEFRNIQHPKDQLKPGRTRCTCPLPPPCSSG